MDLNIVTIQYIGVWGSGLRVRSYEHVVPRRFERCRQERMWEIMELSFSTYSNGKGASNFLALFLGSLNFAPPYSSGQVKLIHVHESGNFLQCL
ncbi:hypothetical protein DCAR_0416471 [Daucus carota subsp. sativus]|uniref:Uncharacterized protein n=1 Tax=Daucus carota subsp. sativus TaxID=79200 RepID=A0A165XHT1_DAUCS|nr:hypothetical protein DCAR_0416471 [Daucus carota subsp. sativus]